MRIEGTQVSASLFPMLGKHPALGRDFRADDDRPGNPAAVALISHQLWERRFDVDPGIVGETVRLDGVVHEIVGVMEPGFGFPEWADVWTPLGLDVMSGGRDDRWVGVMARLAPGATIESATAEMRSVAAELEQQYPETNTGWSVNVMPVREDWLPDVVTTALSASLVSGLLVLLVVCANVASLILAQATARAREMAVRTALGASRWRLIRQSLTEGIVLALVAGVVGVQLSALGVATMLSWIPVDPPYLFAMDGMSPNVLIYTVLVCLFAGVVCGLVPAWQSSRRTAADAIRASRSTSGTPGTRRFGRVLVSGELALSTALLIAALLVVKSFLALQSVEPGYRTDSVLTATLELSGDGLDEPSQRLAAVDRVLASLRQLDGAETVGVTTDLPAGTGYRSWALVAEGQGQRRGDDVYATVQAVAGDYLETLAIPVLHGRDFTDLEKREGGDVVIVSRTLATALWGTDDPVGRQLRRASGGEDDWLRVVGVVGDVDYGRDLTSVGTVPEVQLYLPLAEPASAEIVAVVATSRPPRSLAGPARRGLAAVLPGIPVDAVDLETVLFRVQWVSRFFGNQLAIYGFAASLIAALGLYGLMSHAAGSRHHELAVRSALGRGASTWFA